MSNVSIMAHGSRLTAHGSRHILSSPVKFFSRFVTPLYRKLILRNIHRFRKLKYILKESSGKPGGKYVFSHVSHYLVGNAGDTVLSTCVRMCFRKFFDIRKWNLISTYRKVTPNTVNGINHTDMLIIGGGGLFMRKSPEDEAKMESYRISGWQWGMSKENLARIKCPVVIFSCGYNYFRGSEETELFRENVTELARKSVFFGLRNHGSIRAIQKILPEELRSKVTFQPCTTTVIRQLYGENLPERREKSGKCVAFNMAEDQSEKRFGANKEAILQQTAKAIKRIEDSGCKIFYVCHCGNDSFMLPYLAANDVHFELRDFVSEQPGKIIDFYNSMDIAIGMRGHAQMIPFGVNTEILTLGSHDKMLWFLEDIDASDWYVEMSDDPENLCDKILDRFEHIHVKNPGETHERLISQQKKLWDVTQRNMEFLRGILSA